MVVFWICNQTTQQDEYDVLFWSSVNQQSDIKCNFFKKGLFFEKYIANQDQYSQIE